MKKWIFSALLFLSFFQVTANAISVVPISDVYKEGIYRIPNDKSYVVTAELVSDNTNTSIILVDENSSAQMYCRLMHKNEKVNLGEISNKYTMAILGNGEVSLIFTLTK